ncbi:MAG: SIS domain-containing protein, partial [bacterium]
MNTQERISKIFDESINLKNRVKADCLDEIMRGFELINETLASGNKLLIFGNGGSAADAQHFACEIVGRCVSESPARPAISLNADSTILTAASNDYGFESVFARQIEAHAKQGDLVIGITTSGNSPNICLAFETARKKGVRSLGLLGNDGGKALEMVDHAVVVPS